MASPVATTVVKTAGTGTFASLKFILKTGFWFIIVFFILINSVARGIEERSVAVVFMDLGERFFLVTQTLNEESLNLIENQGFKAENEGFFDWFNHMSSFLSAFFIIYAWIKALAWIWARTPWSNTSNWFINMSMALIIFVLLQVLFIVIANAVIDNIGCYADCDNSAIHHISVPFIVFYNFVRALPYVVRPITKYFENMGT